MHSSCSNPFHRLVMQNFNLDLPCQAPALNYPMHYWFCLPKTKRTVSGIFFSVLLFHNYPFINNSPCKQPLLQNSKVKVNSISTLQRAGHLMSRWYHWTRAALDSEFRYKPLWWLQDGPEKGLTLSPPGRWGEDGDRRLGTVTRTWFTHLRACAMTLTCSCFKHSSEQ